MWLTTQPYISINIQRQIHFKTKSKNMVRQYHENNLAFPPHISLKSRNDPWSTAIQATIGAKVPISVLLKSANYFS